MKKTILFSSFFVMLLILSFSFNAKNDSDILFSIGSEKVLAGGDCTSCKGTSGTCITIVDSDGKEHEYPGEAKPCGKNE